MVNSMRSIFEIVEVNRHHFHEEMTTSSEIDDIFEVGSKVVEQVREKA